MNPQEFYDVCSIAKHPPVLVKPHVDGKGDTTRGQSVVGLGMDFYQSRLQDVDDVEILVKNWITARY